MSTRLAVCLVTAASVWVPLQQGSAIPRHNPSPTDQVAYNLERLKSPDAESRRQAARALGDLRSAPEVSVPALINMFRDSDSGVANEAALGTVKFGQQSVRPLIDLIVTVPPRVGVASDWQSFETRTETSTKGRASPADLAASALYAIAGDASAILDALNRSPGNELLVTLIARLKVDPSVLLTYAVQHPAARRALRAAIESYGMDPSRIIRIAPDGDRSYKAFIASLVVVSSSSTGPSFETLLEALQDRSIDTGALFKIRTDLLTYKDQAREKRDAFRNVAFDDTYSWRVRQDALDEWSSLQVGTDVPAVPSLSDSERHSLETLILDEHTPWPLRGAAFQLWSNLPFPSSNVSLPLQVLQDSTASTSLKQEAALYLGRYSIKNTNSLQPLLSSNQWSTRYFVLLAALVAAERGIEISLPALIDRLNDSDERVVKASLEILSSRRIDARLDQSVIAIANNSHRPIEVREAAFKVMAREETDAGIEALLAMIEDSTAESALRTNCIEYMVKVSHDRPEVTPNFVNALNRFLKDERTSKKSKTEAALALIDAAPNSESTLIESLGVYSSLTERTSDSTLLLEAICKLGPDASRRLIITGVHEFDIYNVDRSLVPNLVRAAISLLTSKLSNQKMAAITLLGRLDTGRESVSEKLLDIGRDRNELIDVRLKAMTVGLQTSLKEDAGNGAKAEMQSLICDRTEELNLRLRVAHQWSSSGSRVSPPTTGCLTNLLRYAGEPDALRLAVARVFQSQHPVSTYVGIARDTRQPLALRREIVRQLSEDVADPTVVTLFTGLAVRDRDSEILESVAAGLNQDRFRNDGDYTQASKALLVIEHKSISRNARKAAIVSLLSFVPEIPIMSPVEIRALLDSPDEDVRYAALRSWERLKNRPQAAPQLTTFLLLKSDRPERSEAATLLLESGQGSVRYFRRVLVRGDSEARFLSCEALGRLGTGAVAALPELQALLHGSDNLTRRAAAQAIYAIDCHEAGCDLAEERLKDALVDELSSELTQDISEHFLSVEPTVLLPLEDTVISLKTGLSDFTRITSVFISESRSVESEVEVESGFPSLLPIPSAHSSISQPELGLPTESLGIVFDRISTALRGAGFGDLAVFRFHEDQPPDGFAVVTKVELFDEPSLVSARTGRFQSSFAPSLPSTLLDYLRELLLATPGNFRLFVFIVTRRSSLEFSDTQWTEEQWRSLEAEGFPFLDDDIANIPLGSYKCHLLVYHLIKRGDRLARLVTPADEGTSGAEAHAIGAGICRGLLAHSCN